MRSVDPKVFKDLNKPSRFSTEPVAKEVGTYDMARMIAKKTKFRVLDVKEVLDELGPCVYGILLSRKTAKFDSIYIRSKWKRFRFPRFVRYEGPNDNNGYWTYGYYYPIIDMDKPFYMLYAGKAGSMSEEFIDRIEAYVDCEFDDANDLVTYSRSMMDETGQLGKDQVVDKEGYTIPLPPRRKRYFFDPDFHPTFLEKRRYQRLKRRFLCEYHAYKYSDTPLPFSYVWDSLKASGIFETYHKKLKPNMVIPEMEEEQETDDRTEENS